jgi:hypothetical protein
LWRKITAVGRERKTGECASGLLSLASDKKRKGRRTREGITIGLIKDMLRDTEVKE